MSKFCTNCGTELDDEDKFCKKCGFKIKTKSSESNTKKNINPTTVNTQSKPTNTQNTNNTENTSSKIHPKTEKFKPIPTANEDSKIYSKNKEDSENNTENKLITEIPLILAIISIIIGIIEGLSCPMIIGIESIIFEMAIAIVGGCIGIYLFKKQGEYLIAGIEFLITGFLMFFALSQLALIGTILFIATGILSICLKERKIKDKRMWAAPIVTIVIPIIILILIGGAMAINDSTLGDKIHINNVQNGIANSYGSYSGDLKGDISLDSNFDYIELDVKYLDANGKVLNSGIGWNQNNAQSGQTYQFTSYYYGDEQPVKAEISVVNDVGNNDPIYVQNVTLA